jgi:hypothetical protein
MPSLEDHDDADKAAELEILEELKDKPIQKALFTIIQKAAKIEQEENAPKITFTEGYSGKGKLASEVSSTALEQQDYFNYKISINEKEYCSILRKNPNGEFPLGCNEVEIQKIKINGQEGLLFYAKSLGNLDDIPVEFFKNLFEYIDVPIIVSQYPNSHQGIYKNPAFITATQ